MKRIQGAHLDDANRLEPSFQHSIKYQTELTAADIWRILVKRKVLILFFALIGLGFSLGYVYWKTPIYQATASIQIDPSRVATLGLSDNNQSPNSDDDEILSTDIQILSSTAIATAAIDALPADEKRIFAGPAFATAKWENLNPAQRDALARKAIGNLKCKRIQGTQIIQVQYRDTSRRLAMDMANNIVDAFLKGAFQSRYKSVEQVSTWLWEQMKDLKDQSASAQRKLATFQEQNNILVDSADVSGNTTIDKLKQLSDQLTTAQADRITKESRYKVATAGNPQLLTSLVPDTTLEALQSEHAQVFAKFAELSSRFGPGYPPLQDSKAELAKLEEQINAEVATLSQRLEREYLAAAQTEAALRNLYEQQTQEAYSLNRKVAEYALLKDQGDSSRNLYNVLQAKLAQASVNAGLGSVNSLVMDRAALPTGAVEPQVSITLVLGLALGLVTGIGTAFLGATNESNVESIEQIEAVLGLPTLALVPRFSKEELSRSDASLLPEAEQSVAVSLRLPRSHAAESYRTLRNSVLLTTVDRPVKTVLFTSALPGEGKSTSAVNFAIVLAQKGARVLLVDADLRRPSLSRIFRLKTTPGLSTNLVADTPEDNILQPINSIPELSFMPAGPMLPSPSEALGSIRFFNLLDHWSRQYDYVILDSAPVLGLSDSIPLASWCDAVLVVARFRTTPLKALMRTRDVLSRANAHIHGFILNGADWASRDYYLDNYAAKYKDYYV